MVQPALILLVDDDATVRAQFSAVLERGGYRVSECEDGDAALEQVKRDPPALIILDVEMPRLDGWKTLAELRRRSSAPAVLMVTHVNDVDARVHGLEIGADDYLGKPCDAQELLARVRALLRRVPPPPPVSLLHFGPIVVDLEKKTARRDGVSVGLTRTEFALLQLLRDHAGTPVSREKIIAKIWGGRPANSHALDTHLWRLRQKLDDVGDEPRWIRNLAGIGYVLADEVVNAG